MRWSKRGQNSWLAGQRPGEGKTTARARAAQQPKWHSPGNSAVIECVPTRNVDRVSFATPPFIVAVPIAVVPTKNFTWPINGLGPYWFAAWAFHVTACPSFEGLGLAVRVVVVGSFATTCVNVCKLEANQLSPGRHDPLKSNLSPLTGAFMPIMRNIIQIQLNG